MEKLEKGYTREELSAFMQQAFKNRKTPRRTADGGWEAVEKLYERTFPVSEHEAPEATVTEASGIVEVPPPKKKGWFKSLFGKKE
jgi:hypothetical protein